MTVIRKEFSLPSASGQGDLYACLWLEEGRTAFRGVLQIAHGMAEHILRYEEFAKAMCKQGYVVCGNDHTGHGRSVHDPADFGYFGEEDGSWHYLLADMHFLKERVQKEYPDLPYVLLGHSMGSFLARAFSAEYGSELAAAIYVGTAGANPLVGPAIAMAKAGGALKGHRSAAPFMNKIAFSNYNDRFDRRTEFDWINSNDEAVDTYIADPLCGYLFTYAGYRELFNLLREVNSASCYSRIPKDLPLLLVAGAMDPVGNFGRGVTEVANKLKKAGVIDVTAHLYSESRHELLNEPCRFEAYGYIASWLNRRLP